jgi:uncharacterized protein YxeA
MKKIILSTTLLMVFVTTTYLSFNYSSLDVRSYVVKEDYYSGAEFGYLSRNITVTENANIDSLVISLGLMAASSLIGFCLLNLSGRPKFLKES